MDRLTVTARRLQDVLTFRFTDSTNTPRSYVKTKPYLLRCAFSPRLRKPSSFLTRKSRRACASGPQALADFTAEGGEKNDYPEERPGPRRLSGGSAQRSRSAADIIQLLFSLFVCVVVLFVSSSSSSCCCCCCCSSRSALRSLSAFFSFTSTTADTTVSALATPVHARHRVEDLCDTCGWVDGCDRGQPSSWST
ncbi:hypothetical protein GOODEAATRI_024859 [Goodea atripinnis]|uniref:Uncharacterized protein n=1 Tax=Goodea atripinnis TaxID=208336 RepID=A0ABV0NN10_9TELE